ncbi:MAG: flavodoxin-like domain-containing protein [Puniceicoccales bacterium]|jgi:sulfite reductase (NADPH) flavoprotein alpha-component|nr:flavodoxin-like domain-containing protein [Puniceicoccales bacterium]
MSKNIAIYYGTMTGNSEALAQSTYDKVTANGWTATLHNLADAKVEDLLANAPNAIFIVSTWGDGEPPSDAEDFFADLSSASIDLSTLKHAVFGLGDSNYEQFNAFAKNLDAALVKFGSTPVEPVFSSDVSYEGDYETWEPKVLAILGA